MISYSPKNTIKTILLSLLLGISYPALAESEDTVAPDTGTTTNALFTFITLDAEHMNWNLEKAAQALSDIGMLGATGVRTVISWEDIEPKENKPDPDKAAFYTELINMATDKGLTPVVAFGGMPSWASGSWRSSPNTDALAIYVNKVLNEIVPAGSVSHWQLWDEQNNGDDWGDFYPPALAFIGATLNSTVSDPITYLNVNADDRRWKKDLNTWLKDPGVSANVTTIAISHFPGTDKLEVWRDWHQLKDLADGINGDESLWVGKKGAVMKTGYSTWNVLLANQYMQQRWIKVALSKAGEIIEKNNKGGNSPITALGWSSYTDSKTKSVRVKDHLGITENVTPHADTGDTKNPEDPNPCIVKPYSDQAKYNEVFQPTCHNCYEKQYGTYVEHPDWKHTHPECDNQVPDEDGYKGFQCVLNSLKNVELDFYNKQSFGVEVKRKAVWYVRHKPWTENSSGNDNLCVGNDGQGGTFNECVAEIADYMDKNPEGDVITLFSDKKQHWRPGQSPADLDNMLTEILGDKIFTPSEMRSRGPGYSTLREAAQAGAWPTMEELKGRIIIVLNGGAPGLAAQTQNRYGDDRGDDAVIFLGPKITKDKHITGKPKHYSRYSADNSIFYNIDYKKRKDSAALGEQTRALNYVARMYHVEDDKGGPEDVESHCINAPARFNWNDGGGETGDFPLKGVLEVTNFTRKKGYEELYIRLLHLNQIKLE